MQAADARLAFVLYAVFYGLLLGALVYIFYSSPLRERVENRLYDIRSRLAPRVAGFDQIAVIGITDATIRALEGEATKDLSYRSLIKIVEAALTSQASSVVVLLTPQVFPYDSAGLDDLAKLASQEPRLILGTFGVAQDLTQLPESVQAVRKQVVAADIDRTYRLNVIRSLQIVPPKSADSLVTLAQHFSGITDAEFRVNWRGQSSFHEIEAAELADKKNLPELKDRIALIAYTAFRPSMLRHREATYVNTPWQADGDDVKNGVPLVYAIATGLSNVLEKSWLRPVPLAVPLIQTFIVSVGALAVWSIGSGIAAFLFLTGWVVLIFFQSLIFSFANLYIPLADTLLFSCIATTFGGLWRIRVEARLRAAIEAQEHSEHQIALVQDRFLDRFAHELSALNLKIRERLAKHRNLASGTGSVQKIYTKAIGSSDELAEYLDGIRQFASTRTDGSTKPLLRRVVIAPLITKVLRQFESRKAETGVDIQVTNMIQTEIACAMADPTLTGQILYNLISNALKYSPRGAKIEILLKSCRISNGDANSGLSVSVVDKGPGISPEYHERIFEKFYRVKDDYVYKVKGHGLGLYLSRFFADQMGAALTIESDPGRGATFTLILPAAHPAAGEDL